MPKPKTLPAKPTEDVILEAKLQAGGRFLASLVALREQLRRQANDGAYTQAWVGARMGMAQPNVHRLESGISDPHLSTLERYLAALDCDLELHAYAPDHRLVASSHPQPTPATNFTLDLSLSDAEGNRLEGSFHPDDPAGRPQPPIGAPA